MEFCFGCFIHALPVEKLLDEAFINERLDEFYPIEEYHGEFPLCMDCVKRVMTILELTDE